VIRLPTARGVRIAVGAAALVAAGVGGPGCLSEPSIPLDAPEGWLTDGRESWWLPDADTALAFRDLETLESMGLGVESPVYSADRLAETQMAVGRFQITEAIRRDLLPLYRNHPEIVDSLFRRYVADDILPAPKTGDVRGLIQDYRRDAYRTLMRHFRAPATLVTLGRDIPVPVPDSLRSVAAGRSVSYQVFVGADGRPRALRLRSGIHPVLDRIALRAVTQVTWQPAYVLRGGRSRPIDAWVRFGVRFPELPGPG
jgi:hypothetical protein